MRRRELERLWRLVAEAVGAVADLRGDALNTADRQLRMKMRRLATRLEKAAAGLQGLLEKL